MFKAQNYIYFKKLTVLAAVMSLFVCSIVKADEEEDKRIVVKSLPFGEILYDYYMDNYFDATVKLLVAKEQGTISSHREAGELMIGGLYLSYGLHLEAEKTFKRLIKEGAGPEIHDKAWFNLATVRYKKGLYEDAIRAIEEIGDTLPPDMKNEKDMMMANLLMARGQYDEATALLRKMLDRPGISEVARFNLGVALFRSERQIEGAEQLDRVGRVEAVDDVTKAIRDKANVALGYSLLAEQEALKARAYFQRVRVEGPYSNKALLGLGWSNAMLEEYKKAMSPWVELTKRDRNDTAVYEALLASAYGLEQLQAYPQSMQSYNEAISVFQDEMKNIEKAIEAVRKGELLDRLLQMFSRLDDPKQWLVSELPDIEEARYLTSILVSHEFHDAIKTLRELTHLDEILDKWSRDIPTFKHMLKLRKDNYKRLLPQLSKDKALAQITVLKDERNLYKEELDRIVRVADIKELATDKEREQLKRLEQMRNRLRLVSDKMDPEKHKVYQERYQFYRGLLEWDIGTTINSRKWKITKSMRELDRELEKTAFQQKLLQRAKEIAPRAFEGYNKQISHYTRTVKKLQGKLKKVYKYQKQDIQALIVAELIHLKQNLTDYLDQALYATARLQDIASRNQ